MKVTVLQLNPATRQPDAAFPPSMLELGPEVVRGLLAAMEAYGRQQSEKQLLARPELIVEENGRVLTVRVINGRLRLFGEEWGFYGADKSANAILGIILNRPTETPPDGNGRTVRPPQAGQETAKPRRLKLVVLLALILATNAAILYLLGHSGSDEAPEALFESTNAATLAWDKAVGEFTPTGPGGPDKLVLLPNLQLQIFRAAPSGETSGERMTGVRMLRDPEGRSIFLTDENEVLELRSSTLVALAEQEYRRSR